MSPGFAALSAMLKARSGLNLRTDKAYLLEMRLAAIMKRENAPTLDALAARVRPGSTLEHDIVEAMTTNESLFFRDTQPFEALQQRILPRLHAARKAGVPLRLWSAAASTGQEAYSMAMIAAELAGELPGRRVDILATDIARAALERGRGGLYTQFEIQRGLPMRSLVRYFAKEGVQWRISPSLRAAVTFREWNLLADLRALGQFDVVFCRNVLIYFDMATRAQVLENISRQMAPDGVLFLGCTESVLGLTESFRSVPGESAAFTPSRTLAQVA